MGEAHYVFNKYGMWYFEELTKLCVYDFQFMFQVLSYLRGRARGDLIPHTMIVPHLI